jgi:hypothetical protein
MVRANRWSFAKEEKMPRDMIDEILHCLYDLNGAIKDACEMLNKPPYADEMGREIANSLDTTWRLLQGFTVEAWRKNHEGTGEIEG